MRCPQRFGDFPRGVVVPQHAQVRMLGLCLYYRHRYVDLEQCHQRSHPED